MVKITIKKTKKKKPKRKKKVKIVRTRTYRGRKKGKGNVYRGRFPRKYTTKRSKGRLKKPGGKCFTMPGGYTTCLGYQTKDKAKGLHTSTKRKYKRISKGIKRHRAKKETKARKAIKGLLKRYKLRSGPLKRALNRYIKADAGKTFSGTNKRKMKKVAKKRGISYVTPMMKATALAKKKRQAKAKRAKTRKKKATKAPKGRIWKYIKKKK